MKDLPEIGFTAAAIWLGLLFIAPQLDRLNEPVPPAPGLEMVVDEHEWPGAVRDLEMRSEAPVAAPVDEAHVVPPPAPPAAPVEPAKEPAAKVEPQAPPQAGHWTTNYAEAEQHAQQSQKQILAYFTMDPGICKECGPVKKMFEDPEVSGRVRTDFSPLYHYTTESDDALAGEYKVTKFPTVVLLNSDGSLKVKFRPAIDPQEFLKQLERYSK